MPANVLDRAIEWLSPKRGAQRMLDRSRIDRAKRFYQAASAGRDGGWSIVGGDANTQVVGASRRVREAAHDLVRNNPYANKAVQTWKTAAAPLHPRAQLPGVFRSRAPAQVRGGPTDRVDTLWWEHWQAVDETGGETYDETMVTGTGALVESGEYLVRRIDEPMAAGLPLPVSLQMLEPDYLDETRDRALDDGRVIVGGVEFMPGGRQRRGYWLYREHPSAYRAFTKRLGESVFVPADEVVHVYEKMRPGQVRGISWFAPAVLRMHDLDAYDSYELIRKKAEACLVAVVFGDDYNQTLGSQNQVSAEGGGDPRVTDAYGTRIESFEPGMIVYSQGRSVEFNKPQGATDTGFSRHQLHACAAALGITYERLTGDLSQVSFISGRMGEIQFQPRVRQVQRQVLQRHGQRVWNWAMRAGYAAGKIDRPDYWARFAPPPRESVQPLDDATADLLKARMGRKPVPAQLAENGEDWLETLDEYEDWNKELDRRGMVFDSDPRRSDKRGQLQQAQNEPTTVDDVSTAPPPGAPPAGGRTNGHGHDGLITQVLKLANGSREREIAHDRRS